MAGATQFFNFAKEITFPVNVSISRIFQAEGLDVGDFALESSTMEAAKLTTILRGITAGIYFTHIATIDGVRNSLLASLRLVQCIRTVDCPAAAEQRLPTDLMVKTLMKERYLVPSAY